MFSFKLYDFKKYDVILLASVLILSALGAFCIYNSDGQSMFKHQIMGIFLGLLIIVFLSIVDYHFICKFVILYYLVGVAVLFMVRFTRFGVDHTTGAYRWLNVGFTEVQPSELVKIILILTMAAFLNKFQNKMDKFYVFVLACIITAIPTFLILIQTDLSSSMVMLFIFVIMIFSAGLSFKIIIPVVAVGVPVAVSLFWYVQQPFQKLLTSYQQERILSFLNPETYANSGQYQQNKSIIAISSGGLYGKFFTEGAESAARKYNYVYVNESDFIFSVLGEELGFFGSLLVIALFALIIIRCIMIANRSADHEGRMIAMGVSGMIMFQSFANIGVATAILPNTGLPLPFLSFGLSSLLGSMISIGLILNVGLYRSNTRPTHVSEYADISFDLD
ncbi:MAG: rod shape-determining protein RodA [Lachnospiraceae bacterium]|jgi:rod shape determining protein RodA|nr:rod shape-determining protein RodA [Lachnospiraceae bacterium]